MTKQTLRVLAAVGVVLLASLVLASAPALAQDRDGDADSNPNTAFTEDNDTNDGNTPNNIADERNAHPSGKDRSVEHDPGNQGNSESNPDDSKGPMRHEGSLGDDKPNGPGGTDLADQDGNNGCGNDDDFDDDNNGWCGKPAEPVIPGISNISGTPPPTLLNSVLTGQTPLPDESKSPDVVLGGTTSRGGSSDDEVLGSRTTAGEVLPLTGASLMVFILLAVGLLLIGAFALRAARDRRTHEAK